MRHAVMALDLVCHNIASRSTLSHCLSVGMSCSMSARER